MLSPLFRKLSILASLMVMLTVAVPARATALIAGEPAPNFSLKNLEGKRVTLEQFKGKTVVIAFWSTWCSRCEEELTFLRDQFGTRTDVAVLLINQDSEKGVVLAKVQRLRDKLGIAFPILIDEGLRTWEDYGINALPTSVVVDKTGAIKFIEPNFYWASPDKLLNAVGKG
ncbi:MAG TPA: redoxin domain-containing protein [Candidatus Deferrimicrobiaceae bacterium]